MTNESVKMEYPANGAVEDEVSGIKEGARRAVKAVKAAVSDGVDAVGETCGRAADGVKSVIDDPSKIAPSRIAAAVREIVREHPLTALAAVAIVSVALGRAILRR